MTSYPDSTRYVGTLSRQNDVWRLVVANGTYDAPQSGTLLGSPYVFLRSNPLYCEGYSFMFVSLADSISGTFSYQTDCHGLGTGGAFTGHR